jgi:hypothetical protein
MDSRERAQQLMYALMPYAEKMLGENGGFMPYAGVMTPDDEIHVMQFTSEGNEAEAKDIFDYANVALREGAQQGKWTATALVADVNVDRPDETGDEASNVTPEQQVQSEGQNTVQAVSFAVDDNEGTSVEVFFPYTVANGTVNFGTAFAQAGAGRIFGGPA